MLSALRSRFIIYSNFLYDIRFTNSRLYSRQIWKTSPPELFRNLLRTGLFAIVPVVFSAGADRLQIINKENSGHDRNVAIGILQSDEYFKIGKFEESYNALKIFEDLDNAEVLWRLARAMYNMTKENIKKKSIKEEMIIRAYEIMKRALVLDDKNYAVHKWMAILLDAKLELEGVKARIEGLPEFKKHLMIAMELNPKDATTIYILGQYCYNLASMPWYQKKIAGAIFATPPEATFEEALFYFSKAEEVEPNFYSLNLLMLGKTYLQMGKMDAARYWLKCASMYPLRTEEDKQVRKEAEELLKKNPFMKQGDESYKEQSSHKHKD